MNTQDRPRRVARKPFLVAVALVAAAMASIMVSSYPGRHQGDVAEPEVQVYEGRGNSSVGASSHISTHHARAADEVVDAYGINIKSSVTQGVYGNRSTVLKRLRKLGVRHVRDRVFIQRPDQYQFIRDIAATGIRFNVIAGDPTYEGGTPEEIVGIAAGEFPDAVETFEGANEWNLRGGSGWVQELGAHQGRLFAAVQESSRLSGTPVLAPALGLRKDREQLGDLSAVADFGNNHLYSGGRVPSTRVDQELELEAIVTGDKPVIVTESGYHNALETTSGHFPTSERATAQYMPRLLFEYFRREVPRVFSYQLIDQTSSPEAAWMTRTGLLRSDYSPKPAYRTMKNTLRLLADPGPTFTPGALAYGLRNASADLRQVLVQKRNGNFYLVLWRDVEVWDPIARTAIPVQTRTVTVDLAEAADVRLFKPSKKKAVSTRSNVESFTVGLRGSVKIVKIRPGT